MCPGLNKMLLYWIVYFHIWQENIDNWGLLCGVSYDNVSGQDCNIKYLTVVFKSGSFTESIFILVFLTKYMVKISSEDIYTHIIIIIISRW